MTRWKLPFALFSLLTVSACDDAPEPKALPTFESPDAGEAIEGQTEPERSGPQYAVISSDWKSTSVSLLDVDGKVLADDYINSGSARAGLVSLLSGDVALPTRANDPGVLVLIDRFKTDVITRVRLSDGKILGQLKTHTPPEEGTTSEYTSNPHDYVRIDDETAWVTRNQPNLNPGVPDIDKGNDLLRIDPSKMERTSDRIDLSSLNGKATRKNPDSGKDEEVDVYARPSRMARVGDTLIVGLDRSAFDFSAHGSGMVAVVDLETASAKALALADFAGCVDVLPIPGDEERVLVSCTGDYVKPRETAGHAIVRMQKGRAAVELTWRAQDYDTPILASSAVALGGTLIGVGVNNFAGDEPSVFGVLDVETGLFSELASLPLAGGTFGTPHYDAEQGLLILPDSSADQDGRPTGGLRLFAREGDDFEERSLEKVAEETTLPVRQVRPL